MLRAIRTTYRSYKFLSSLEARWAFWLDQVGIRWRYEPVTLDLGDGLAYRPDFDLFDLPAWLEIKGEIGTDERGDRIIEKCSRLAIQSQRLTLLTFKDPMDMKCAAFGLRGRMYPGTSFTTCAWCGAVGVQVQTQWAKRFLCPKKGGHSPLPLDIRSLQSARRLVYNASIVARQRRFGLEKQP